LIGRKKYRKIPSSDLRTTDCLNQRFCPVGGLGASS